MNYTSEAAFQVDCFTWFWNNPDFFVHRQMLFHVQQKAKNAIEGARFKAMGVVRGVSDFILITYWGTVYIELKLPGETQSEDQISFMKKVRERGHKYFLVYTLKQFQDLILGLLNQ